MKQLAELKAANGYPSPLDLPEGKVGSFQLIHTLEEELEVVGAREAMLTGKPLTNARFDPPRRVHHLYENGQLWVADIPMEVRQHQEALRFASGRVLVGGLGLGIAAALLAQKPHVTSVEVVEKAPEVVELCRPKSPKVVVHIGDFNDFLSQQKEWRWDDAFIDLWRATSEGAWWEEVLPIRRTIGRKFGPLIGQFVHYWAEDIMLGQVVHRLTSYTPPHWYYKEGLKLPMTMRRARHFVTRAGTPYWERRYGKVIDS